MSLKLLFGLALLLATLPTPAYSQIYLDIPGFGGGGGLFGGQDRRYDRRYDRRDRRYNRGYHDRHGYGPNYLYQDPYQQQQRRW
jgi:hypothetical protein